MNPFQKNKVDISTLTAEEQKVFRLYGKLPDKKDLFQNKLKERKYFDSGDYAMSKAGKAGEGGVASVGREHPQPQNIPHLTSTGPNGTSNGGSGTGTPTPGGPSGPSGSPVKESSFLHRETSADEPAVLSPKNSVSPVKSDLASPPPKDGVPVRWQN